MTAEGSPVYRRLSQQEFNDIAGRILYEDNHLLIFNKRSGEIVQADKTEDECMSTTLKAFVAQRDNKPGAVFMGVVHRLNEAFRTGQMHKTYWAVVCNRPKEDEKLLTHYLTRNEKQNKTYTSLTPKQGAKEAKLRYKFLKATERYFLLEVELFTGRHHQIRAQLSAIGCVIKGDLKYGAPRSNPDGSISLHSRHVRFTHPVRKEEMEIVAPPFCPIMKSCL